MPFRRRRNQIVPVNTPSQSQATHTPTQSHATHTPTQSHATQSQATQSQATHTPVTTIIEERNQSRREATINNWLHDIAAELQHYPPHMQDALSGRYNDAKADIVMLIERRP